MLKFGFRSTFKSLFNVKSWVGWDSLSQNGSWIRGMLRGIMRGAQKSTVSETFEEACQKYGYTPEFLVEQEQRFAKAAKVYLAFLAAGFCYMIWLYVKQHYAAFIVMAPLNFMLFALYFRESFWLMQIQQKRLGMSMRDWFNITVLKNEG